MIRAGKHTRVQVRPVAIVVQYRERRRGLTELFHGQTGQIIEDITGDTAVVQFDTVPALVVVPITALEVEGHQPVRAHE